MPPGATARSSEPVPPWQPPRRSQRPAAALLLTSFAIVASFLDGSGPRIVEAAPTDASGAAAAQRRLADCLSTVRPRTRPDFPVFLNCLGLTGEAVEVGVQAGVHAGAFLERWEGRRLRLVDRWGAAQEEEPRTSQLLYVDIANLQGADTGQQHKRTCEARLAGHLQSGRAELMNLDSTKAAAQFADGELDFVYLDARHDFVGVVDDIHAWWPKVRPGGVFAGHDFVDGEFPEGDFFWIAALRAVLPALEAHTHVTTEANRYPSFYIVKTEELATISPQRVDAERLALQHYAGSPYLGLWRAAAPEAAFQPRCEALCGRSCAERVQRFTPTQSTVSTLRPFDCGAGNGSGSDSCSAEIAVDVAAYRSVCLERCRVTCLQRAELFSTFGEQITVLQ
eukprot:TRINITY_DN3146_c1_g1_i1.p1 TRINITY_DN3146_c1_g1~~TRINITY_DN3146_c1_g1_i1.p1  ORF type:complete len:395 (-),score=77.95 TRINITY_DN3146_c1_g1_i1:258-1442(-)